MTGAKARTARRVLLGTGVAFAAWLGAVWPPPAWWATHDPRCTAMMRERSDCPTAGRPGGRTVAPAPVLQRMVIIAEDSRFRTHHGIDFIELREALADGAQRGASTITQQLAKNLYLSSSRNPLRKIKEAVTAVRLELALPKERIMALYLDVAEWGPGVWGARQASAAYFGVTPDRLSPQQAAALAATLPHPRSSNPAFRPSRMLARRALVLARYFGGRTPVPRAREVEEPPLVVPEVPPVVLPEIPLVHQP